MRGVLFGYQRIRGEGYTFAPLNGGVHGGTITLYSKGEIITLQRYADPKKPPIITLHDGRNYQEDDYHTGVLGGADQTLFKSVFAFSLDELFDFSSLSKDKIGEGIEAAGIAGAGNSAKEVIKTLEKQTKELISSSKKSVINGLDSDLKLLRKKLKEAKKASEEYPGLITDEEGIQKKIVTFKEKENRLKQSSSRYNMLLKLWPAWNKLKQTEESRISLFPGDKSIVSVGESPSKILEEGLPEDELADVTVQMEKHDKHLQVYCANIQQLPKDKAHLVKKDLKNKYAKLGPGWDEKKIDSFDTSISKEEEVYSIENEINDAIKNYEEIKRKHQDAEGDVEKGHQTLKRIQKILQDMECQDEKKLEEKINILGRFRANRKDVTDHERDIQPQKDKIARIEQRVIDLEYKLKSSFPKWPLYLILCFSILSIITTALLLFTENYIVALLLFFLGAGGGITWILLNFKWQQSKREENELRDNLKKQKETMESTELTIRELEVKIDRLKEDINKDANVLKLSPDVPLHTVENLETGTNKQLQELETMKNKLSDAKINLKDAEEKEKSLSGDLEKEEQKKKIVDKKWSSWIENQGIGMEFTPQRVIDLFRIIEGTRNLSRDQKELLKKIEQSEQNIKEWEEKSRELLGHTGFSLDKDLSGDALIFRFSEVLEKLKKRKELFHTIKSLFTRITESIGKGKEAEDLLKELDTGNVQEWKQESETIDTEKKDVEEQLEKTRQHLSDKKIMREEIEKSNNIAELETEIEGKRTDISVALRKWRVQSLAKTLIEETLNIFVHNRQPAIYADASNYFKKVTMNRYPKIVYDEEAKEPAVFDDRARRKKIRELSRGTREQLYLCIRLGLASEFAGKGANLPLVMDDVLVNFDLYRAKAMARSLIEYSKDRQILFFTCHQNTVEIFKTLNPETNVIPLETKEQTII